MVGLAFVPFQLPTLVETPPTGDDWIHEIKYDGYRTEIILQGGEARALTRRGVDWSAKYHPIVAAAAELPAKSAILDGEMVVLNDDHVSDIGMLRTAIRWNPERIVYVAFDLLHLDGEDLRKLPLVERRARLEALVEGNPVIQFSQNVEGGGAAFFAAAERLGLEGMVSKRPNSRYKSDRTETWLKTKCYEVSTYEIAGVLREPGRPTVAYMVTPDRERRYVGGAFVTLPNDVRERLWQRVQAGAKPVKGVTAKPGTEWLKPGVRAKVRHLRGEELLRHATLREIDD